MFVHKGEVVGGLEIYPVFLDDLVEVQKLFPGIFHGLIHKGAVKVVERDLAVKIAVQLVQEFFPDGKWLGQAGHHLLGELLRGLPQPPVKGKFQAAGKIEHA